MGMLGEREEQGVVKSVRLGVLRGRLQRDMLSADGRNIRINGYEIVREDWVYGWLVHKLSCTGALQWEKL